MLTDSTRYHPVSRALHWVIAGLIVLQFVLAKLAERAESLESAIAQLALLANHKSVGITVLVLVIVRLLWRWRTPPPALPDSMGRWQVLASNISHWGLYGLIVLLPVSGWLMSSASAYSVSWFNVFQLPDLVAPDPNIKETFESIHEFMAKVLLLLASIHLLAAIKHHVVDKNDVLRRMTSPTSIALFVAVIAVGAGVLGKAGKRDLSSTEVLDREVLDRSEASAPLQVDSATLDSATTSELVEWQIDYADSYIKFTGDQAGARFDGIWQEWTAQIRFDGTDLPASRFDVTVGTDKVETDDDDRDATLVDADWFDSSNHPFAYYRASDFISNGDETYTANGQLIIKGFSTSVPLIFSVSLDGPARVLTGSAAVLRLDLGVGTGEWEDTTWVSNEVSIAVRVSATVNGEAL